MAIFTDPIREHADFGPGDAEWLHLLVGDWQMVADNAKLIVDTRNALKTMTSPKIVRL